MAQSGPTARPETHTLRDTVTRVVVSYSVALACLCAIAREFEHRLQFFSSAASPALGVHAPTIAVVLDYSSGWHRPCDGHPYTLAVVGRPRNWGVIPYGEADFAVDHVFETIYPGYRESDLVSS